MLRQIILLIFICVILSTCDSHIVFYGSSNFFMDGDNGRTSGSGWFGQYRLMIGGGSGGCCPSSASFPNKGKPKGEIVVRWQAIYNKKEKSDLYYAYDPNPVIEIPSKGPGHEWYIVFYSFGQLAIRPSALTEDQLDSPWFYVLRDLVEHQIGHPNYFYYKVFSDDENLEFKTITSTPFNKFQKIKGIEVTEKQYEYIIKNKYLDKNAPDLTTDQITYIAEREKIKENL